MGRGGQVLCYDISPLHAWIRFFEFILHISYRIEIKTLKVVLNDQYLLKRKFIHDRIFEKFGLRVDEPRAGESGTCNTGNICRRAFSDPLLLSKILEIDKEINTRLHYILIAINCKEPIDPEKYDKYCNDTYEKLLETYDWFKVPASIHKKVVI